MKLVLVAQSEAGFLVRQAHEVALLLGFDDILVCASAPEGDEAPVFIAEDDPLRRREGLQQVPIERRINLVHPSAVVSASAKLAGNIYVGAQSVVGMAAEVGAGVVQNALAAIEHDNRIGAYTMLGTGAILCGGVVTGENAFIGGGATVKPRVTIGAGTTIGTGAVVVRDADPGGIYVGNPARELQRQNKKDE